VVLRHRDFALLWSGQAVSVAGDGIFTVALALETLRVDDRPLALAAVLAARLVPTILLLLLGGAVVDRIAPRLAMLASDLGRGAAVTAIAILVAEHSLTLAGLLALSVLFGVADAFFSPASTAIVPQLLPDGLLVQASAMSSFSRVFARQLLGPALGGVFVAAAGVAWSFGLDGASFAISAVCLALMRPRPRTRASTGSILSDVRAGLGYCRSQPWLWATIVAAGMANLAIFSPLGVLMPLLVRHVLRGGALALGLTLAAGGAGGLTAVLVLARRGQPRRPITSMWCGWAAAGPAAALIGTSTRVWQAAALYAVATALLMYGNALWTPVIQQLVPRALLGRVSSVDWLASIALSPLGLLVAGAVAAAVGVRATILVGGGIASLAGLCLLIPGVRDPDRGTDAARRRRARAGQAQQQGKAEQGDHGERGEGRERVMNERLNDQRHDQAAEISGQPDDRARGAGQRSGDPLGRGYDDRERRQQEQADHNQRHGPHCE
jgi:MFS family permease